MGWAFSSSRRGPVGGESLESACEARLAREAAPPFRPAMRASSEVNSCAVPFWCAAFPPLRAISRCFCGSIEENPRLPGTINSFLFGAARLWTRRCHPVRHFARFFTSRYCVLLRCNPSATGGICAPPRHRPGGHRSPPNRSADLPPAAHLPVVMHGSNVRPIDYRILKSKPRFCRCFFRWLPVSPLSARWPLLGFMR